MMSETIVVPKFATEREEADWWYDNREEHDKIMVKAMAEGRTRRLVDVLVERGIPLTKVREVAVPVQQDDLSVAVEGAKQAGMKLGEYMGQLLHEALSKQAVA